MHNFSDEYITALNLSPHLTLLLQFKLFAFSFCLHAIALNLHCLLLAIIIYSSDATHSQPTMTNNSIWPIAAASRVRVKFSNDNYCRLYYNQSTGTIDLVALTADDVSKLSTIPHAEIYDNSQPNLVEQDPSYQSYLSQSKERSKQVLDSFHPDDVIGANLSLEYNLNNPNTFHGMQSYATAQINIYCYPKINRKKQRKPKHKTYTVDSTCCEDFSDVRALIDAIRNLSGLHNNRAPPQRFLVIINPYSGGNGPKSKTGATFVYETMLKPMLEQAGVEHDKLVTTHGGHAKERMEIRKVDSNVAKNNNSGDQEDSTTARIDSEMNDISKYDSIIAMGGDGILFEIFQGIHARSDEAQILSKMKFGIIPCGTCNGLAASILHWSDGADYTPMESVFQICKGNSSRLDLASYQLAKTSKTYTSFLSFSWGLIADCDLDSECLRWLGALRADIWAVYRGILFPKKYRARFSYLPPQNSKLLGARTPKIEMPKFDEPLSKEWVTIEDDISVFWVCNTSHASFNMFTCPMSKMNDGVFYILIVRSSVSRLRLLQILLKLDSGKHIECDGLEVVCCSAYRLEPLTDNTYNDLDGELIEDGPIQASISNTARFFAGKVDR